MLESQPNVYKLVQTSFAMKNGQGDFGADLQHLALAYNFQDHHIPSQKLRSPSYEIVKFR
jgi:hypothetical protein